MNAVSGAAIAVEGLRVRRGGKLVLHDLSLEVARGRVTGLLGPNGAGKTTLIRCLVGVQIVEAGSVTVLGEPAGSALLRPRIGYMTQAPAVYGDLTVRENLRYFARVLGAPDERVDDVVRAIHLEGVERSLAGRLSRPAGPRLSRHRAAQRA
jgi:ABC-2 type transport system ATP-binding protein